ncbi:MAG: recombinase family protein [Planctomycetes bacterium]|nr:recombinase family protein [Planctomycetota bacterium]
MGWWIEEAAPATTRERAVAYYRHSAQDRQKNSVEIQSDQVRRWAAQNAVEIIHEFSDRGKSGLTAEGRPAFTEMMDWVRARSDFTRVLALDVSRWGRFQDLDLSAQYSAECTRYGKQVVYVNLGIENDGSPVYPLMVGFERWRSAQYSRELSDKVFKGCMKIAEQGYRAGGSAPYATQRIMVNEQNEVQKVLEPGERKSIQNWRVKLAPGETQQVEVVGEIFHLFGEAGLDERQIAGWLNNRGISAPAGGHWSPGSIRRILANRTYAGSVVYNRTTGKLKTPRRHNPATDWVVTDRAFQPVVPQEVYERVQLRFAERQRHLTPEEMLGHLREIYARHGVLTEALVAADGGLPSFGTVMRRLGGLSSALHRLYADVQERARTEVQSKIAELQGTVVAYQDFLVINERLTVLIQPAIPVLGYDSPYWMFRPDHRTAVDITLGVVLADRESADILGYVAMPRLMMPNGYLRLSGANTGLITLHGHRGLEFLKEFAQ